MKLDNINDNDNNNKITFNENSNFDINNNNNTNHNNNQEENLNKNCKSKDNFEIKDDDNNNSVQSIDENKIKNNIVENYQPTLRDIIKLVNRVNLITKLLFIYFVALSVFFTYYSIHIKNNSLDQSINLKIIIDNWISKPIKNITISDECSEGFNVEDLANFNDVNIACDCTNSIFSEFYNTKPHSCGIILNLIGCRDIFVNTPIYLNKWKNKLICTERASFSYYDALLFNSIKHKFSINTSTFLDDLLISRKNKSESLSFVDYITDTYINSDAFNKMEIDVYIKNDYVSKSIFTNYDNWDNDEISYFRKNNKRRNSSIYENNFNKSNNILEEIKCKNSDNLLHDTFGNKLCLDYFLKNNTIHYINNKDLLSIRKNSKNINEMSVNLGDHQNINNNSTLNDTNMIINSKIYNKNETQYTNKSRNKNKDYEKNEISKENSNYDSDLEFNNEIDVEVPKKSNLITLEKEKNQPFHFIKQFDIKANNLLNEGFTVNSFMISEYYPCLIESNKKRLRSQNNYLFSLNTLKEYLEKLYLKFDDIYTSMEIDSNLLYGINKNQEIMKSDSKNNRLKQSLINKKKYYKKNYDNNNYKKKFDLKSLDENDCQIFQNSYFDKRYTTLDLYSFEDYIKNDLTKYLLGNNIFKSSKNSYLDEATISNEEVLFLNSQPFFGWNYKTCSSGIIKDEFMSNLNEFIISLNKTNQRSKNNYNFKKQDQLDFIFSDKNEDFLKLISNINNVVDFNYDPYFIIGELIKNHEKTRKYIIIIVMLKIVISIYVYTIGSIDFLNYLFSSYDKQTQFEKGKKRFSLTFASNRGIIEREYGFRDLNSNLESSKYFHQNIDNTIGMNKNFKVKNKNHFNFLNYSNTKSDTLKLLHKISINVVMLLLLINILFLLLIVMFMTRVKNKAMDLISNQCIDSYSNKIFMYSNEILGDDLFYIVLILVFFIIELILFSLIIYYNNSIRTKRHFVKLQKCKGKE